MAREISRHVEYRLVITARARSIEKLRGEFKEDDRLMIRPLDVTSAADRENLIREIGQLWGGVDILVNNAGVSYRAVVEHMTEETEFHQMATNYFGPVELIRLVLPYMRSRGRGKIINISSVSGMLAMPTMSSYSASKYALEGMSEALWYEMRPLGIDVVLVQPGFIHSSSFQNVYHMGSAAAAEVEASQPYSDYYNSMAPFIEKLMDLSLATPESVARLVLRVIRRKRPPLWVPATLDARIFYYIRRLLPRRLLLPVLFAALPSARHWGKSYTKKR